MQFSEEIIEWIYLSNVPAILRNGFLGLIFYVGECFSRINVQDNNYAISILL
jgi:hypothetical protein